MIKRLLMLAALALATVPFASAQDITGDWKGTLETGTGELRLVLHITKSADGKLQGTMESPDQAIGGAPLDSVTLEGSKVHFTLNVAKGVFDGTLKGNGSISGNWNQGTPPTKYPIVFTRQTTPIKTQHEPAPPSDIDGKWEGAFDTPQQGKVHVTFHIKNTADGLTAMTDCPEMNISGWPATAVTRKGSSVKIAMKQVGAIFQGKLDKSLDSMSGDWTQGDEQSHALKLKRTKEDSPDSQKK